MIVTMIVMKREKTGRHFGYVKAKGEGIGYNIHTYLPYSTFFWQENHNCVFTRVMTRGKRVIDF